MHEMLTCVHYQYHNRSQDRLTRQRTRDVQLLEEQRTLGKKYSHGKSKKMLRMMIPLAMMAAICDLAPVSPFSLDPDWSACFRLELESLRVVEP